MSTLDDEIRMYLERYIDLIVKSPSEYETMYRRFLGAMGVESNLDTIVSVIAGTCITAMSHHSERKFGSVRQQDLDGTLDLLRRRAREIKETFIATRIGW